MAHAGARGRHHDLPEGRLSAAAELRQHGGLQGEEGDQGGRQTDDLRCRQNGASIPPVLHKVDRRRDDGVKGVQRHRVDKIPRVLKGLVFLDHQHHHAGQGQCHGQENRPAQPVPPPLRDRLLAEGAPVHVPQQQKP